jgi:hypothetical protein
MIHAIGEAALQQGIRLSASSGVQQQEAEIRKTERKREDRPIEKSEDTPAPKLKMESNEEPKKRTVIERGEIIVEKYDADGKLVSKTPPGYVPFEERV